MQPFGEGTFVVLEHLLYAVDDSKGRSAAGLVDAHEHAALAIGQNDVCLRRKAVANVGDVLHINRGAVDGLHRQIVEFLNGLRAAIHFDHVLKRAQFRRSRGQDQVLGIHGADNVNRGKSLGLERLGIDVDADDALLAAVGKRRCSAWNRGELGADEIIAIIKELLFAERVARQTNLNHWHSRSRVDNHQGRSRSGRQKPQECLRDGTRLSERRLDVRAGLEEDLDEGNAVERLRLDMLNVADQSRDATFDVRGNALLHFLGF